MSQSTTPSESLFKLKGTTSILIGIYFLLGAYLIKAIIDGFQGDNSPLGMMSAQILEGLYVITVVLIILFSTLAFYFSGRRIAKKSKQSLWNAITKKLFYTYIIGILVLFIILFILFQKGLIQWISPTFFVLYGMLIFILKSKLNTELLKLSLASIILGILCLIIPSYWYSSLVILGVVKITYGLVVKQ